jgi:DNA-binding GntR family transcriptional regulator
MDAITALIAERRLMPGEQVRQEDLATRIGLSRGPIREALKALSAQQIVRYERNRGYFVNQFSAEDIAQVYWLRTVAETELLRSIKRPTSAQLKRLKALNARAGEAETFDRLAALNDEFHLLILSLSPKKTIFQEVERWWKLTAGYRVLSLSVAGRDKMRADHEQMLAALEAFDIDALIELADSHRAKSAMNLMPLLPPA